MSVLFFLQWVIFVVPFAMKVVSRHGSRRKWSVSFLWIGGALLPSLHLYGWISTRAIYEPFADRLNPLVLAGLELQNIGSLVVFATVLWVLDKKIPSKAAKGASSI